MKTIALTILAILSLVSCDPTLKVKQESTQEVVIPGVGIAKRYRITSDYGTDSVYVIDRTQPVSVNHQEGKIHKATVIIDGVTYEAK